MVRLGVTEFYEVQKTVIHFNSSMVRLGARPEIISYVFRAFQFQYGTIGGEYARTASGKANVFQFQYGTIGGHREPHRATPAKKFQFQYGTIGGCKAMIKQNRP